MYALSEVTDCPDRTAMTTNVNQPESVLYLRGLDSPPESLPPGEVAGP